MINKQELKAVLARHGDRQEDLAIALDMSVSALNMRINGSIPFRQPEIEKIALRYKLTAEDIQRIFFAQTCYQQLAT
jgi:hypothetical protein